MERCGLTLYARPYPYLDEITTPSSCVMVRDPGRLVEFSIIAQYFSLYELLQYRAVSKTWQSRLDGDPRLWVHHKLCVGGPHGMSVATFVAILKRSTSLSPKSRVFSVVDIQETQSNVGDVRRALHAVVHIHVVTLLLHQAFAQFVKILCQQNSAFQHVMNLVVTDDYVQPQAIVACLWNMPHLVSFRLATDNLPIGTHSPLYGTTKETAQKLALIALDISSQSLGFSPLLFMNHLTQTRTEQLQSLGLKFPHDSCLGNWTWLERLPLLESCSLSVCCTSFMDIFLALEPCVQLRHLLISIQDPTIESFSLRDPYLGHIIFSRLKTLCLLCSGSVRPNNAIFRCRFPSLETLVIDEHLVCLSDLTKAYNDSHFPALRVIQLVTEPSDIQVDTDTQVGNSIKKLYPALGWKQSADCANEDNHTYPPVAVSQPASLNCTVQ